MKTIVAVIALTAALSAPAFAQDAKPAIDPATPAAAIPAAPAAAKPAEAPKK